MSNNTASSCVASSHDLFNITARNSRMQPILDFRNELYHSTLPENKNTYRNFKRRTGKVSYARGDIANDDNTEITHIPGPYWLSVRKS